MVTTQRNPGVNDSSGTPCHRAQVTSKHVISGSRMRRTDTLDRKRRGDPADLLCGISGVSDYQGIGNWSDGVLEYRSAELNRIEDEHEYENDKAHRISWLSSSSYPSSKIQSIDHSEHATQEPRNPACGVAALSAKP